MNRPPEPVDPTKSMPPPLAETMPDPPPAAAPAPAPKLLLKRYRVIGLLGRGGMGEAYHCHDTVSGTDVAVKVMRPEFARRPEHVESVRANFALIERLHHPNIAALKTLERDPATGSFLVVMEYVQGQSLDRMLGERGGRLAPAQAALLVHQLASALDCGHREKIIHRDLKPSNVMIDHLGRAKLLDFGIAERFHGLPEAGGPAADRISGTAPYMAPEQWLGRHQDARTDQYALAVLAHHLLAARPPFVGRTGDEIKAAALSQPPDPPREWAPALRAVIIRGLAKNPEERFPDCEAFARAFAEAAASAVRPAGRGRLYAAAGLAALALVSAGVGLARRGRAPSAAPRAAGPTAPTAVAAAPQAKAGAGALPSYSALVIGISKYRSFGADGWDTLTTARNDAAEVGRVLAERYGFRVQTLLDEQATRTGIMDALDALTTSGPGDAVLVYYAGHGFYEGGIGEGYWIPQDARRVRGDKPARDEWIWNSTLTKLAGASPARHVLIIADACFAGSLFRGVDATTPNRQLQWYRRALNAPSRYLITSGDLEPVLDSGAGHSIFCSTLLNYLQFPEKPVFSASDLGVALRKVSPPTGQLVRMGQMPVASHAGGEFVFVSDAREFAATPAPAPEPATPAATPGPATRDWTAAAQDAIALAQQGATGSAQRVLSGLAGSAADPAVLDIVRRYVSGEQRRKDDQQLQQLIDRIAARKNQVAARDPRQGRPRVVSFVDARVEAGAAPDLFAVALYGRLVADSRIQVVQRADLARQLGEQSLSGSEAASTQGRLDIGQVLPASLVLVVDSVVSEGKPVVFARLSGAESSAALTQFEVERTAGDHLPDETRKLADEIAAFVVAKRPLEAGIARVAGTNVTAALGRFQGVAEGWRFDIQSRNPQAASIRDRVQVLGRGVVTAVDDFDAELAVVWTQAPAAGQTNLWVREAAAP